jgi:hypothetical protein
VRSPSNGQELAQTQLVEFHDLDSGGRAGIDDGASARCPGRPDPWGQHKTPS